MEFVEGAKTIETHASEDGEKKTAMPEGNAMAYYKVRIEVWCDWNPAESDLEDIAQSMGVG